MGLVMKVMDEVMDAYERLPFAAPGVRGVVMAAVVLVFLSWPITVWMWWRGRRRRRAGSSRLDEIVSVTITKVPPVEATSEDRKAWSDERRRVEKLVAGALPGAPKAPYTDQCLGLVRAMYEQSGLFVPGSVEVKLVDGMVETTGTLAGKIRPLPTIEPASTVSDHIFMTSVPGVEMESAVTEDQRDGSPLITSRRVVSELGAAVEVTELELSPEARAGLTVPRGALDRFTEPDGTWRLDVEPPPLDAPRFVRAMVVPFPARPLSPPITNHGESLLREALERSGAFVSGSVEVTVAPPQTEAEKARRVLRATAHITPPRIDEEKIGELTEELAKLVMAPPSGDEPAVGLVPGKDRDGLGEIGIGFRADVPDLKAFAGTPPTMNQGVGIPYKEARRRADEAREEAHLSRARECYEAFRTEAGKVDGPLPTWGRLNEVERRAWLAVGKAMEPDPYW